MQTGVPDADRLTGTAVGVSMVLPLPGIRHGLLSGWGQCAN